MLPREVITTFTDRNAAEIDECPRRAIAGFHSPAVGFTRRPVLPLSHKVVADPGKKIGEAGIPEIEVTLF